MKYKKILIFIFILVCLFSISHVVANDVNETVMTNDIQNDDLITVENQDVNDIDNDDENEIDLNEINSTDENYEITDDVLCSQEDDQILSYSENEDVLGASPPYNAYSVSVSDTTINYGSSGNIIIKILSSASTSYSYRYDFYLRVYDSNNNLKISNNYYSSSSTSQITHTISANQLDPGSYTIKLVNYADNKVMATAKLTITSIPHTAYSVSVSDTSIEYGTSGNIKMNIRSSSGNYYYKYDYYLKVYDIDNNLEINSRFYSTYSSSQQTYSIYGTQLNPGKYTIKIINTYDDQIMDTAKLTIKSIPHTAYSVSVSNSSITQGLGGNITMDISPASPAHTIKYDYYLKVYDQNSNEIINQRYYSTTSSFQKTYTVSSSQLSVGTYLIKIINCYDNQIMSNAHLTVVSVPHNEYSVTVPNMTLTYGCSDENILMNINPASSYSYKYDYYLKVYDLNNTEKISQRYYSTSATTSQTYTISSTQLEPGTYTIKIINNGDNYVMSVANLTVIALTCNEYSVNVSNTIINYGMSSGSIIMNITPAPSNYKYKYDYYLKVYDLNNNVKISRKYSNTSATTNQTYTISSTLLQPGTYTIKIINTYDNQTMDTANLTIKSIPYTAYSVSISNTIHNNGLGESIYMYISPPSSSYYYSHDYYFKIYDANNNEKISERYYSTYSYSYSIQKKYYISTELNPGTYTIKIINTYDNQTMATANLTVFTLPSSAYSIYISNLTHTIGLDEIILMNITPASESYAHKYDYYMRIYDSNNNQKINYRYYSDTPTTSISHSLNSQLDPGIYTIKIINVYDNNIMSIANLTVVSVPHDAYSVNVSNTTIEYGRSSGSIIMNITPASSSYANKYDYYLKVYDLNNNEKISQRYYSTSATTSQTYTINPTQLNPGIYTIKIINNQDNQIMNNASLTVVSVPHDAYSVNVSNTTIEYGKSSGYIRMNINSASSSYYYKYDYNLKIYDTNNNEKISQRYYNIYSTSQESYYIYSTDLTPGKYTIKIINNQDNQIMSIANLTVVSVPHDAYSVTVQDAVFNYGKSNSIIMNINSASSSYYCKYDYYLKIYDTNNNTKISKRIYSTNSYSQESYYISTQLNPGTYTIKIINTYDNQIMDTANLTIKSTPYTAYSVNVNDKICDYGIDESLTMSISSASSSYYYRYDYYLKIYDTNNKEKISQRYSSRYSSSQQSYSISTQLNPGTYTIKIINTYDNQTMATAKLTILALTYDTYSVNVDDTITAYGFNGKIEMNINPAPSPHPYKYDYYLKVYDTNNNTKISKRYSSTSTTTSQTYTINTNQLEPGNYTIKIMNKIDNHIMATANLTVLALTYDTYSVNVENTSTLYGLSGSILMNIIPSSPPYLGKYDYYLKVFDSNNTEQISQRYSSTSTTTTQTYTLSPTQLEPGTYTLIIINTYDNQTMNTAKLTVSTLTYDTYSVNVTNTTVTYALNGNIEMSIIPADSNSYKYDYYLKVYDTNNNEKISQRFYGTSTTQTYTIPAKQLTPGLYTIKIINTYDNQTMDTANLKVLSVPHTQYSVSIPDKVIKYESSGNIQMTIAPASSSYYYRYDYYLKIYDLNNNEKISQRYYSTSATTSETYSITAKQLTPGTYTIKIMNNIDDHIMATAKLTILALTYDAYSVNVTNSTIAYESSGNIQMTIAPASSSYYYKYDYYLKIYDTNNNEKISQRYYSTSTTTSQTHTINANQLKAGTYTIKIINTCDNQTMATAKLTVFALTYDTYSVNVSNTTIAYESSGNIRMNINPASSPYYYKYDYYLKVYDTNNNEKISQRYSSTSTATSKTYSITANQLEPGTYTIKIINTYDNTVMNTAKLTILALTYDAYSVSISNMTMTYRYSSGSIKMNINSAPSAYYYKYDYYLKVYDTNNNEKISQRYSSTSTTTSQTYSISSTQLQTGTYTIKIINTYDNQEMSIANLTVISVPHTQYSVSMPDTVINYETGGSIKMSITPASSSYYYRSDYYLKIYDTNNNEKISQRYSSTSTTTSQTHTINAKQLTPGIYTMKIMNNGDNHIMHVANLTILSVPYNAYSVNVSNTIHYYGTNGTILMDINPASLYVSNYDYYLKVYDSNNTEIINQRCYSTGYNTYETYNIMPTELNTGKYTIKLINTFDNHIMSYANLTVLSVPYNAYSTTISNTTIIYGVGGSIIMNITPAISTNSCKYDYYLKIYDSNNTEIINQRFYSINSNTNETYYIYDTQLNPGTYTIKLINTNDNYVMDTAYLSVKALTHDAYSVNISNTTIIYNLDEKILMNITTTDLYNYRYDFYLIVYDTNNNTKISQRYYNASAYSQDACTIYSNQLELGTYTIKIINTYDNQTMNTACLSVKALTHDAYSINVPNTMTTYGFEGKIIMNISSNSSAYLGKYDYCLVVYDSNGAEKIIQWFNNYSSNLQATYKIDPTQLTPGNYKIRIFNNYDDYIMSNANLTVNALTNDTYSVNVSNTTSIYGIDGSIIMNITPSSYQYLGKYDYYLRVYDSNGIEIINQRYQSTDSNLQETYVINSTQLLYGIYTIELMNAYDNCIMSHANLTVLSVPHNAYSANVSNTIITYGVEGNILVDIAPAPSTYLGKYDFYLVVYDSNGIEIINQRYYSNVSNIQEAYNVSSTQLNPGNYTIKLINNVDNYIMDTADLVVLALTYDTYSVNVSDTEIAYGSNGSILMEISPASFEYSKKYDYYLEVYNSIGNLKISLRYENASSNIEEAYNISPTELIPGHYIIKIINYYDNKVMDSANLTITSTDYSDYSVNISDITIDYEDGGKIMMNITSNSSSYYQYDYYLKVYNMNNILKISKRFYKTSSKTQEIYTIDPTALARGEYRIEIVNNVDNHLMNTAKLYVLQSSGFEISSQDYGVGEIAKINYNIHSQASGNLTIIVNDNFMKNITVGQAINLENLKNGTYTVKVVYTSDNYFTSCEDITQFEVFKLDPDFTLSANDIIADDYEFFDTCIIAGTNVTFRFAFNSDVTGAAFITLEKYGNYTCELVNGVATINISNIKAWDYSYTLTYEGDSKYNPFECEGQINIEYKYTPIDFEIHNVTWGDSIVITPILPEDLSSTYDDESLVYIRIILSYPGDDYALFEDKMKVGESYNLTVLYGGDLVVTLFTHGDNYYGIGSCSKAIYVDKLNTTCNISDTVEAGDYVPITVGLNEDATGSIWVSIDDSDYYDTLTNGTFTFKVPNIEKGIYTATINYYGDTKYNAFTSTTTINVTSKKSNVNLTIENILTGKDIYITPIVSKGATGNFAIYYDNNYNSTINVGATLKLSKPKIGKHEVKVIYSGDDYFAPCENTTIFRVFTIYPIEAEDMEILYNSGEYFQAKFYDEYGIPLTNKYVVFNVNGTDYAKLTNQYGIAILDLNLPIGFYEIKITNPTMNEHTKRNLLIFSSIKAMDMTRAYNSGIDFNATFLDSGANPLSNSYVLFKVNGTDYPVFTDINGVARLNVPLSVGNYEVISINTETNENITNRLTIIPSIQADNMIRAYNSTMDYKAKFLDKNSNPLVASEVSFVIGTKTYKAITDNNGLAILNIPLRVGEYNVTAINPITGERSTKNITILPRIIENNDIKLFSDSVDYFVVKAIDDDGNSCRSGETVVFKLNNTYYNIKTDNQGYAKLEISLTKGLYPITATYKGFTTTNNILVLDDLQSIINIEVEDIDYTKNLLLNVSILPEYSHGNITLHIFSDNGYDINFTQKPYNFTKKLSGLEVSSYVVVAEYLDLDNYYFSQEIETFEVSKINPNLIVVAYGAEFGQNATITINIPQVNGNVTTKIGNKYEFTDFIPTDGVIVKRISTLEIGEYPIIVTYNGNDNYNTITKTAKLNITKIPTTILFESEDEIDYGQSFTINITSSVDGIVRVQINNEVQFISIKANEIYKLVCSNYDAGEYDVLVNLTPSDTHYEVSSYEEYVYVDQIEANLYVYAHDIELGKPTNIVVELNKQITGSVRLELNNHNYTREINNGTVLFNIEGLISGNYTVYVYYDGNKNYESDYDWDTFEVTKIENIDILIPETIKNDEGIFAFNLPNDATGNVTITIDGTDYTANVVNGNVNIDLSSLINGNYDYTLHYTGDDTYDSFTRTGTLTINRNIDTIDSQDMIVDYDEEYDFKATFFESNGSPLSNNYVIFTVNGTEHTVKTNTNGVAVLNIELLSGTYTIVSFNIKTGDSKTNTLTIIGGPKQITIPDNFIDEYGDIEFDLPTDATGTITLTINNKNYTSEVHNGKFDINLQELSNGDYPYTISYSGDENYLQFTKSGIITISRVISTIKAKNMTIDYGNDYDFQATFFESNGLPLSNKYIVFRVNNKDYTVKTDADGLAILKIGLNSGTYTITSINTKTDETKTNTLTIKTTQINENDINIPPLDGNSETITVTLPNDATGTITLTIDGKNHEYDVINGVATITIPDLANGTYDYNITYSGNGKYAPFTRSNTVIINKITSTIKAKDMTIDYGNDYDFQATFFESNGLPLSNKYIVFRVNNKDYTVKTDADGLAILKISLNSGTYTITSINTKTDETKTNTLTIKTTQINENDINIPSLDGATGGSITIKLPSDAKGTITLTINGKNYNYDVVNGIATVDIPDLANGAYEYNITYSNDVKYAPFTKMGTLNVNKVLPVTISSNDVVTTYNVGNYLTATLKDSNGKTLSGLPISININGNPKTLTTDINGQVRLFVNNLVPKSYAATLTFDGNSEYGKSTSTVKITVKKGSLKLTAAKKTFKRKVKIKKYTITLKNNQKKAMKKVKVTLNIKGKKFTAKTNKKGKATFKIKKFTKKGKFNAKVKFAGNSYYKAVTKKVKITIK